MAYLPIFKIVFHQKECLPKGKRRHAWRQLHAAPAVPVLPFAFAVSWLGLSHTIHISAQDDPNRNPVLINSERTSPMIVRRGRQSPQTSKRSVPASARRCSRCAAMPRRGGYGLFAAAEYRLADVQQELMDEKIAEYEIEGLSAARAEDAAPCPAQAGINRG